MVENHKFVVIVLLARMPHLIFSLIFFLIQKGDSVKMLPEKYKSSIRNCILDKRLEDTSMLFFLRN